MQGRHLCWTRCGPPLFSFLNRHCPRTWKIWGSGSQPFLAYRPSFLEQHLMDRFAMLKPHEQLVETVLHISQEMFHQQFMELSINRNLEKLSRSSDLKHNLALLHYYAELH